MRQWREAIWAEDNRLDEHPYLQRELMAGFFRAKEFHLKLIPRKNSQKTEMSALTWPEYLRLLQTAQTLGDKRTEMLVKLFCKAGIRLRETPNVALEAVNAGEIVTGTLNRLKCVPLSPELRKDCGTAPTVLASGVVRCSPDKARSRLTTVKFCRCL